MFTVTRSIDGETAAGPARLLEVEMQLDGRRFATLWCDDAGTVHRQALADSGLELALTQITDANSRRLWPPPADPDAVPPGAPLPAPESGPEP